MTEEIWRNARIHTIGIVLSGNAIDDFNERGERIADDTFLFLINASPTSIPFTVPSVGDIWEQQISTNDTSSTPSLLEVKGGQVFNLEGRSIAFFRRKT